MSIYPCCDTFLTWSIHRLHSQTRKNISSSLPIPVMPGCVLDSISLFWTLCFFEHCFTSQSWYPPSCACTMYGGLSFVATCLYVCKLYAQVTGWSQFIEQFVRVKRPILPCYSRVAVQNLTLQISLSTPASEVPLPACVSFHILTDCPTPTTSTPATSTHMESLPLLPSLPHCPGASPSPFQFLRTSFVFFFQPT